MVCDICKNYTIDCIAINFWYYKTGCSSIIKLKRVNKTITFLFLIKQIHCLFFLKFSQYFRLWPCWSQLINLYCAIRGTECLKTKIKKHGELHLDRQKRYLGATKLDAMKLLAASNFIFKIFTVNLKANCWCLTLQPQMHSYKIKEDFMWKWTNLSQEDRAEMAEYLEVTRTNVTS